MAIWTFIDKAGAPMAWKDGSALVSNFDDGLAYRPGEEGFSRAKADAKAKAIGGGAVAQYTGTPNWHERVESEAKAAADAAEEERKAVEAESRRLAAEAEIDALLKPAAPTAENEVNAKYDALLEAAPDRASDVEKLRSAELEALAVHEEV